MQVVVPQCQTQFQDEMMSQVELMMNQMNERHQEEMQVLQDQILMLTGKSSKMEQNLHQVQHCGADLRNTIQVEFAQSQGAILELKEKSKSLETNQNELAQGICLTQERILGDEKFLGSLSEGMKSMSLEVQEVKEQRKEVKGGTPGEGLPAITVGPQVLVMTSPVGATTVPQTVMTPVGETIPVDGLKMEAQSSVPRWASGGRVVEELTGQGLGQGMPVVALPTSVQSRAYPRAPMSANPKIPPG